MTTYQTLWTMSSDAVTRLTNQNQFGAFSVHVDGSDNSVIFVTKKPSTSISIDLQDKYGLFASSDTSLNVYSDEGVHVSCDAVLKKKYIWNGFSLELDKTSGDLSTPSIQITNNTGKDAAFGLTKFDTKSNTYLPICVDVSYASRPKSKPTLTFIYTPTSTIYARILSDSNPIKDPKLPPTMTTGSVIPDIGRWTKFKISKSNTQFNLDLTPKLWVSSASTTVATFPAVTPTTSSPSPPTDITPTPAPTLPPPPPLQAAPSNPSVSCACECSRKDASEREVDEDESTEIESLAVSEVSMPDYLCNCSVTEETEDGEESQSRRSQSDASSVDDKSRVGDIFVRYNNVFKGSELQDAVFVKYNLMKEEEEAEAEEEADEGESDDGDHSDCEDDNCDEKSVGNLFVRYNRSLTSETRGSVDEEVDEVSSCSETATEAIVRDVFVNCCSDSDDESAREAPQEKRRCRASARPARSMWRRRDEARAAQSESDSASENDEGNEEQEEEEQEEKEEKPESKEEEGNQRVVFAPEDREDAESLPLGNFLTRLALTLAWDPVGEPIPRATSEEEKDEQEGEEMHEYLEEEKDDTEAKRVDSYPEENEKWNDSFGGIGDFM